MQLQKQISRLYTHESLLMVKVFLPLLSIMLRWLQSQWSETGIHIPCGSNDVNRLLSFFNGTNSNLNSDKNFIICIFDSETLLVSRESLESMDNIPRQSDYEVRHEGKLRNVFTDFIGLTGSLISFSRNPWSGKENVLWFQLRCILYIVLSEVIIRYSLFYYLRRIWWSYV